MNRDKNKISVSWSGGKDSAFALWKLMNNEQYDVVCLHTTFGEETRRVGMHGVHEDLIEAQAKAIGLRLDKIYHPASGDNAAYEMAMGKYLTELSGEGIRHIGYGDIFLEDLRRYREQKLNEKGFAAVFPLWKRDTEELVGEFLKSGFKTKLCAADASLVSKDWVGKDLGTDFLSQLPLAADPCGENGEFHSFCYQGPVFSSPIDIICKDVIQQSYDFFLDDGSAAKKHFWFAALQLVYN